MFRSMRSSLQMMRSLDVTESLNTNSLRLYASSNPTTPTLKINDNMMLQKSSVPALGSEPDTGRPLVLLLSWLVAKQRHISNFSRIYLDRGCDVLVVRLKPTQILLPERGSKVVAQKVVDFIQMEGNRQRPIFVHSFSVGGYMYAEILQKMVATETTKGEITGRVIGQVYDSVVDLDKVAFGISNALFTNKLMQKGVERSIDTYLAMMDRVATQHYVRASRIFYHTPVTAPALFFYSYADPVGCPHTIEKCVATLRNKMGYNVSTKAFEKSRHVTHMYTHREEYMCELASFLQKLPYFKDLSSDSEDERVVKAIKS